MESIAIAFSVLVVSRAPVKSAPVMIEGLLKSHEVKSFTY
jgi:hypothetical protein